MSGILDHNYTISAGDAAQNETAEQTVRVPCGGVQVYTGIIMTVQLLAVFPVSILIGYLVISQAELRKGVNFILLNGTFAECLLMSQWAVLNFYYNFIDQQALICSVAAFIDVASSIVAVFNGALVAWNRYLALHDTIRFEDVFSPRNTALLIAGLWLVSLCMPIPLSPYFHYAELHHCSTNSVIMPPAILLYYNATPLVLLLVAACTIISCNVRISRKLAAHRKLVQKSNIRNEQLENGGFENIQRLLYIGCFLPPPLIAPFNVLRMFPAYAREHPWACRLLITVDYLYPCVAPYILIACLKPFREAIKDFIRRKAGVLVSKSHVVAPHLSNGDRTHEDIIGAESSHGTSNRRDIAENSAVQTV